MRTKNFTWAMIFAIAPLLCLPNVALADCGKIIIYRPPVRVVVVRPVPRPVIVVPQPVYVAPRPVVAPNYNQGNQVMQQQQVTLNNANNNVINVGAGGVVPPPPPASGGAVAYGDKAFLEGAQQAVIAWNGKTDDSGEQTLILTTNEMSNSGEDMAMLSVLPLPGKPKSIERANAKVFVETKMLLDKKLRELGVTGGIGTSFGVIMTAKIGSHNIFVWEMEDISTFKDDINAYIAETYKDVEGGAAAHITEKTLQIIKGYHDRGFRYFAFDLTEVKKNASTKEAIAYRFQSKFAYYPLAISGIGGTGHGLIDLIVMTPGSINLSGSFEKGKEEVPVIVKGNTAVDFTMAEVKGLDPSLDVFGGLNSVRVRNFLIEAQDIGTFKNDFIAIPAP
jgi:hypothetical protein